MTGSTARLGLVAPELVQLLGEVDAGRLRAVAEAVAALSADGTALADPRVDAGLIALRAGVTGKSERRSAVQVAVEELDARQWDVQDQVDAGTATTEEHLRAFRQARAANAVWFALSGDPVEAAAEAVYEANAAIGDLNAVLSAVRSAAGS